MFKEKKALKPVMSLELTKEQRGKLLCSHMFVKEKKDGKGVFEKMKGRLVGVGCTQDKKLYQRLESLTKPVEDVFMELELALRKKKKATKIDVSGAYLNAEIDDEDKIMIRVTKKVTCILVEAMPELRKYASSRDRLVVRILRALYNWYSPRVFGLSYYMFFLTSLGFVSNNASKCVMNLKNERELTIILYVDDILSLWESEESAKWLVSEIRKKFK